ncbi:MAG TPA: patatin-like phospholipase family protein [Deltaproteobacteria bacterium]|nr:patatin-like phospholipase family protein [Deltaproteobacteria bacterium]
MKAERPRIGIALDSGGAMGGAHVGVLEVLGEQGVPLDIIVGSSAGAAVGAFYAAGRLSDFKALITDISFVRSLGYYVDPVFPYSGLLAGDKARRFIAGLVGEMLIEDLDVTFVAVATDLLTGETVAIDQGPLADAVMASIAIPGIFRPVVHMGRLLTDGGVSDPLPLDILKGYAPDISIACNLHPRMTSRYSNTRRQSIVTAEQEACASEGDLASGMVDRVVGLLSPQTIRDSLKPLAETVLKKIGSHRTDAVLETDYLKSLREYLSQGAQKLNELKPGYFSRSGEEHRMNIVEILLNTTNIQQYQKNRLMLKYEPPDVLIEPDVIDIASLEFTRSSSAIEEGRKKTTDAIPQILKLMEGKGRST